MNYIERLGTARCALERSKRMMYVSLGFSAANVGARIELGNDIFTIGSLVGLTAVAGSFAGLNDSVSVINHINKEFISELAEEVDFF